MHGVGAQEADRNRCFPRDAHCGGDEADHKAQLPGDGPGRPAPHRQRGVPLFAALQIQSCSFCLGFPVSPACLLIASMKGTTQVPTSRAGAHPPCTVFAGILLGEDGSARACANRRAQGRPAAAGRARLGCAHGHRRVHEPPAPDAHRGGHCPHPTGAERGEAPAVSPAAMNIT